MKQPKVQLPIPPIAPPAAIIGPRYRYFSEPPAMISVRVGDLVAVPAEMRASTFESGRMIELPSEEILGGPIPKITLGRLAELAPDSFRAPVSNKTSIPLPTATIARAYRLIARQEMIEDVPMTPPLATEELAEEKFAAPESLDAAPPLALDPAALSAPLETPEKIKLPPENPSPQEFSPPPPVESVAKTDAPSSTEPLPPVLPSIEPKSDVLSEPAASTPLSPPAILEASAPAVPPPQNRRIFSMMPMFRRKTPPAPVPPPPPTLQTPEPVEATPGITPKRPRVELPPPKLHISPPPPPVSVGESLPAASVELPLPPPLPPPHPDSPAPDSFSPPIPSPKILESPVQEPETPLPEAPSQPAILVETEHLPKALSGEIQLAHHDDLQAIFMTEEMLSVDRVIELCGGLPGIRSCVLSRGSSVITSHNVPDSIDLVSLSAHAVDMLKAMRASSARMGVGAVPAVTLHSEKGPITFFNQEDVCLLILHKDRGFVPGVREKIQDVVDALAKSNLPRPLPSSSQPRILEG